MLFWLILTTIAAVTLAVVLRPLLKNRNEAAQRGEFDAEVYRDQLKEIEMDVERQLLSAADADAARTEISRRLLQAGGGDTAKRDAKGKKAAIVKADRQVFAAAAFALICIPALSLALYLTYGSPQLPG
ncbi:MAG: c-type cytochrome biogenesis protein CcmI, partial [Methyloligellaceae bacterium]